MSTLRTIRTVIGSLLLAGLLLSGCSFGGAATQPAESEAAPTAGYGADEVAVTEKPAAEPVKEEAKVTVIESPRPALAEAGEVDVAAGAPSVAAMPTMTAAPDSSTAATETDAESYTLEVQQAQSLRAGEVDDNARWDDYLLYRRQYQGPAIHDRDVSERYIVEVKDGQDRPVLGATVRFFIAGQQQGRSLYEARTYANGQVLFHPLALSVPLEQVDRFLVQVEKDTLREEFTLTRLNAQASTSFSERWTVTLDSRRQFERINLDVLFLVDATGSMSDEIAKIQDTIFDVSARIDALPGQPDVRYGMVTYRDRGDAFVTKTFDFTPDVQDFSASLSTVSADGGGDTPESLNEALHQAVNGVEWRSGETVQLVFLVADAPPHLDYPQDYDYVVEMDNAARQGIKIFPIASSGLDDQGEYIFRQLAQYTQGRFIFLTYAGPTNSGAPGEVTTHHVDDYSVANLDDLLVGLVEEELAYQSQGLVQAQ